MELVEHYQGAFQIVDYHALCYLKRQALRQHTAFCQHEVEVVEQARAPKFPVREVQADTYVSAQEFHSVPKC